MADNELKKLNKSVSEALSILKLYVGSSANLKNLNDEQKKIIEGWKGIVDEEHDQLKQKRAFTERERDANGKFIKKQEQSVNSFFNMANSVKGIFSNVASGIKSSIVGFASGLKDNFSRVFQAMKSQFLSLFGEESEFFELIGSIKDSIIGFGKSVYTFIFKKTPSWAKKQIDVLKKMYSLQIKQMKMDFLNTGTKKKKLDWKTVLTLILVAIAAGIGAWLHRKLIVLTKMFPIFKKLEKAFSSFKKLPFIGKFFESFESGFGKISKIFKSVLKKIPILGKLFKAFKFGFRIFGWPLTILLSVIDFIKGFKRTEGSLWKKIKGGLWEALKGFIELPIQFVGWVVERVAGWFGIEIEGVGQKIMDIVRTGFTMILDGWSMLFSPKLWSELYAWMKESILSIIGSIKSTVSNIKETLIGSISNIVTGIKNFFVDFWNAMVTMLSSQIPSWLPGSEGIISGLKGMQITPTNVGSSVINKSNELDKQKLQKQTDGSKKLEEAINSMGESIKESNKQNAETINAINSIQGNNIGGGGEAQQIPDEPDNYGMAIFNYSLGV